MEYILNILENQKTLKMAEMIEFPKDFVSSPQISYVNTGDEFDQSNTYAKWSECLKFALLPALFGIKIIVRQE